YKLYLQGRFFWSKFTPENIRKAIGFYQQAIEKDPNFARAYSGLSDCYSIMGSSTLGTVPPSETFPRMKEAEEQAGTLGSTLGEAYISLAMCAVYYDWDWSAAESAFRKALQLDPNNANSRIAYSCFMLPTGRIEDSIREARRAVEIDPLYVH